MPPNLLKEPVITTRLLLEPLMASHADELYTPLRDDRIYKYIPQAAPASLEGLRQRLLRQCRGPSSDRAESWLNWTMRTLHDDQQPVGTFQATVRDTSCEIAYIVFPAFWGRGYASEAASAITRAIFEHMDVELLTALVDDRNLASRRVLEKVGLAPVAKTPFVRKDGQPGIDIRFEVHRAGIWCSP